MAQPVMHYHWQPHMVACGRLRTEKIIARTTQTWDDVTCQRCLRYKPTE